FKHLEKTLARDVKVKETAISFAPFTLRVYPAARTRAMLHLSVSFPGKPGDALYKMVGEALKAPPFSYGIVLPDRTFRDNYLIMTSGQCALCFPSNEIPGDPTLPKNLRRMDWSTYGQKVLLSLFDKNTASSLDGCVPSLLDLTERFEAYLGGGKGFPQESSQSHRISKAFTDGQILKALWIRIFMQHLVLSLKNEGSILKPGCRLAPVQFSAYRYMLTSSLGVDTLKLHHLVDALFIRGLFARYPAKKPKGTPPDPKATQKKKTPYENMDDFFKKEKAPFLFEILPLKERLEKFLEMLSGLHGDPVKWLLEEIPTNGNVLSDKRQKAVREAYLKQIPFRRIYLPAQMNIRRGRVFLTHGVDALDYYLSRYR
ncbi:hypothetical protein KJ865_09745, partial [Myxococcota bacterium]|nr:hypothetical protein [Myxococcota bacterium]